MARRLQYGVVRDYTGLADEEICAIVWNGIKSATRIAIGQQEKYTDFGVFLSGGLDTGLVAAACVELGYKPVAVTMRFDEDTEDFRNSVETAEMLKLHQVVCEILPEGMKIASEVLGTMLGYHRTEGLEQVYLAYEAASQEGLRKMLGGHGGDELFGGYPWHYNIPEHLIRSKMFLAFGQNLQPLLWAEGVIAEHFGMTFCCPLLDPLVAFTARLTPHQKFDKNKDLAHAEGGKLIPRMIAEGKLPQSVIDMPKRGFCTPELLRKRGVLGKEGVDEEAVVGSIVAGCRTRWRRLQPGEGRRLDGENW